LLPGYKICSFAESWGGRLRCGFFSINYLTVAPGSAKTPCFLEQNFSKLNYVCHSQLEHKFRFLLNCDNFFVFWYFHFSMSFGAAHDDRITHANLHVVSFSNWLKSFTECFYNGAKSQLHVLRVKGKKNLFRRNGCRRNGCRRNGYSRRNE
jgi:hypothetical protein